MSFAPHLVKATAGQQPAVVKQVFLHHRPSAPEHQRRLIYVDVELLGVPGRNGKFRRLRYLGPLTATSYSTTAGYQGQSVTALGGFYDNLYDFFSSARGGGLTDVSDPTRTEAVLRLLRDRTVIVQNLGGRMVVL
jgi:hypothetical protein